MASTGVIVTGREAKYVEVGMEMDWVNVFGVRSQGI